MPIHTLRLARFKRFVDQTFHLRPLTLLTGLNGTGKSTLLQSLLLAIEALRCGPDGLVSINAAWSLALGQAHELFTFGEAESPIEIELSSPGGDTLSLSLERSHDDPLRLRVRLGAPAQAAFRPLLDRAGLAYLCAERLGPRNSLPLAPDGRGAVHVGTQGEFTAHFLQNHAATRVRPARRHPGQSDDDAPITLPKQTEFWMREFMPGLEIRVEPLDAALQAALRFNSGGLDADFVRPTNMGFGVSYALPIIVQGLALEPGGVLVVENPEAHLHPAGQSLMGSFLGRLAADGVQVLVETHSDHVLNGICLATVQAPEVHPLRREDVGIYSFASVPDQPVRAAITFIEIDRRGNFSQNPAGFFDQAQRDLQAILRARTPAAQTAQRLQGRAGKP